MDATGIKALEVEALKRSTRQQNVKHLNTGENSLSPEKKGENHHAAENQCEMYFHQYL